MAATVAVPIATGSRSLPASRPASAAKIPSAVAEKLNGVEILLQEVRRLKGEEGKVVQSVLTTLSEILSDAESIREAEGGIQGTVEEMSATVGQNTVTTERLQDTRDQVNQDRDEEVGNVTGRPRSNRCDGEGTINETIPAKESSRIPWWHTAMVAVGSKLLDMILGFIVNIASAFCFLAWKERNQGGTLNPRPCSSTIYTATLDPTATITVTVYPTTASHDVRTFIVGASPTTGTLAIIHHQSASTSEWLLGGNRYVHSLGLLN